MQTIMRRAYKFETIAEGLSFPWGIVFLSNDEILVTEKTGQLRIIQRWQVIGRLQYQEFLIVYLKVRGG